VNGCGVVPVRTINCRCCCRGDPDHGQRGGTPLDEVPEFVNVDMPEMWSPGARETDTWITFVDSSWYSIDLGDAKNSKAPFDFGKTTTGSPLIISAAWSREFST